MEELETLLTSHRVTMVGQDDRVRVRAQRLPVAEDRGGVREVEHAGLRTSPNRIEDEVRLRQGGRRG